MGKRLSLPFSGAQRALEGFTYRIFDRRQASLPMGPAQAPCLPLSDRSPLLAAAFLPRAEVDRRVIDIWLVDDIPAEGSDMIMTEKRAKAVEKRVRIPLDGQHRLPRHARGGAAGARPVPGRRFAAVDGAQLSRAARRGTGCSEARPAPTT